MIYDIVSLKKKMLLIKKLKIKSAYLFRLFGVHCIESEQFWNLLAIQEYKRIKIIQTILELVECNPEKFYYYNVFEDRIIQEMIDRVESKTQRVINNNLSCYDCLVFGEGIMNTIIEKEYYHIVESDDNNMSSIISEIVFGTSQYYEKFSAHINRIKDIVEKQSIKL